MNDLPKNSPLKNKRAEEALRTLLNNKVVESNYKDLRSLYIHLKELSIKTKMRSGCFHIPFTTLIPFLEKELGITKS